MYSKAFEPESWQPPTAFFLFLFFFNAGMVKAVGPQPDGPVNQNNELKVAEGCIELQSRVLAERVEAYLHLI